MASTLQSAPRRRYSEVAANSPRRQPRKAVCLTGSRLQLRCQRENFDARLRTGSSAPAAGDAGLAVGAAITIWHRSRQTRLLRYEITPMGPRLFHLRNPLRHPSQRRIARGYTIAEHPGRRTSCAAPRHHRRRKNPRLVSRPRRWGPARSDNRSIMPTRRSPEMKEN